MQLKDKEKYQTDNTQDLFPPAPMIPAEKLPDWLYVDDPRKKKKRGESNPQSRLFIFIVTLVIAILPVAIGFVLAFTSARTLSTRGDVREFFDELPANIPADAEFQSELSIDFQRGNVGQREWHYWTYSGESGILTVYVNSSSENLIPLVGLYSEAGKKLVSGYGSDSPNSRTSEDQVHTYPVESGKTYKILVGNLGGIEGTYNIRIERKS